MCVFVLIEGKWLDRLSCIIMGMSAWPDFTLLFLLNVDVMLDILNGPHDSGHCINLQ